jgi:hypothetical protein
MAKRGRPKIKFDLALLEELASIQCTDEEIAACLNCSVDTLADRKQNDEEFFGAYKRGKEEGKTSIRRMQYKAAEKGNTTMLIWLGKQYLGQSDKSITDGTIKQEVWFCRLPAQEESVEAWSNKFGQPATETVQ